MIKICILASTGLPVPAVRGGAIEGLLQILLSEYESDQENDIEISILTSYDKQIDYKNFHKVVFYFIPSLFFKGKKLYDLFVSINWRVFRRRIPHSLNKIHERHFIKTHYEDFDYFIEETNMDAIEKEKLPNDKFIYHLHYSGEPTSENDSKFAYLLPISQYIADNWVRYTHRNEDSVFVLKNCIDINSFTRTTTEYEKRKLKKQLKITDDSHVILFVGRMIKEKGIIELINSLELLSVCKISLLLIGSANFDKKTMTDYEKLVDKKVAESRVNIKRLGYIPNEKVYLYQAISDVQVIPSIWQEPAGLVELEAQAAGIPIVASNVGGIPEFVSPKSCILVNLGKNFEIDLAEAIKSIITDPQKQKEMSAAGKMFAKQFNSKSYYDNFKEIINRLDKDSKERL